MPARFLRFLPLLPLLGLLSGCDAIVLKPFGEIAQRQANLVVVSTILMLLIVLPVMALTVIFAWRYRASNTEAEYDPEWNHSTSLELVIWSAPLLIIIALGAITWVTTHTLDPYRPLQQTVAADASKPQPAPLKVQVVAMDWKWLFIYPDYGIATVNQLAAPVDRPIEFSITATSVMNSLYIPALAGQIYAMPAMLTKLHAVINTAGDYEGFSANYSGAGFSDMRFRFLGMSELDFDNWVKRARNSGDELSREAYRALEKPSRRDPVRYYAKVAPQLFDKVLNLCVDPNKMCMRDMMAIDARGGLGLAGIHNVARLRYDEERRRDYVMSLCASERGQAALAPLAGEGAGEKAARSAVEASPTRAQPQGETLSFLTDTNTLAAAATVTR
ncbi:cytochrome o ubiquinol oxidase subunit 2 [Solimonas aquatica]|uniref:Cytochrome bo(3) ubiquinol oxidase subunit 2 n=1 Tax=Solimonas aquatica TaxID=489703 RepID=A0A1H9IWV4_9GAMM|nr:ubiquinol oxidase subunit II [Solimonas aquatica]SEQ79064.1 cytochrome o ubiquinol oxidase subunit 2 [Solimonas aquatica]